MSITYTDHNENIIDIYSDNIELCIDEFCKECNIDDLCKESQNRFSALLYYLQKHVFCNMPLTKNNEYNTPVYDAELINNCLDYFLFMCDKYDKIATIQGFCKMVGIDEGTIYGWARDAGASPAAVNVAKILFAERERGLSERLISGKVNPVGILGGLNHWHGWSGVGNMQENREKQVATLADVRGMALELSDNSAEKGTEN